MLAWRLRSLSVHSIDKADTSPDPLSLLSNQITRQLYIEEP
jgi:hypothetical protein